MIKIFRLCFVFLLGSAVQPALSQDVNIQLSFETVNNGTGSASGQKILQMRGYGLQAVVAKVFGVQKNAVRIDEQLADKTVLLKIETKGYFDQTDVKPAFIKALKDLSGASVEVMNQPVPVWVAYLPNDETINKSKCIVEKGVSRSVSQTSDLWMASCVTTQELTNKLSEWSDKIILNETMTNNTYDFTIRNKTWQDLVNDLDFNYGIVLTEETRSIKIINVHL